MIDMDRRNFLRNVSTGVIGATLSGAVVRRAEAEDEGAGKQRPNVLFIITDDQGYGDMGCHGNPVLKTPVLDRLHEESVRFTQFYVCPVCSPTRSSLMTGRYNYRTGVVDTYAGRSMMDPSETTIASLLKNGGYRTGIFGKWHLGDIWPLRPMDRGFDESLVHKGGGIAQPSDPEFFERKDTYFNPMLQHNGQEKRYTGYCTDIFTDGALQFMDKGGDEPFFAYVAFNAPHTPLQVPEADAAPYKAAGLQEETALVYGMIANLDRNIGRLLAFLKDKGIEENTLVVFMTDNGSQHLHEDDRYNAGQRGWKGSVYEGGIRVPCFIRRPGAAPGGRDIDRIAAHIDLAPTLLEYCGIVPANGPEFDGVSLMSLLTTETAAVSWPDRELFFQWHRGDVPEAFNSCAVRSQRWKLVNGKELYDMREDPGENKDVAGDHPDVVQEMRTAYQKWFDDVSATRGYAPVHLHLGSDHENPVTLTRQDWRGADNWTGNASGYWEVFVETSGSYTVTVSFPPCSEASVLHVNMGGSVVTCPVQKGADTAVVEQVDWVSGENRLECYVECNAQRMGARFVTVFRN